MPVQAIAAGIQTIGSFVQSNSAKNTAKADQGAAGSIDNQLISLFNKMSGLSNEIGNGLNPIGALTNAKNFYQGEVTGGLDPSVINNANAQYDLGANRGLSNIRNQLGPALPNLAGSLKDYNESTLQGRVGLEQQLAAQNQAARQQGAQGLAGIGSQGLQLQGDFLGGQIPGLYGLGQQFSTAASNAAGSTSGANNPFASLANFFAQMGGGGGQPGGTGSLGTPSGGNYLPQGYTGPSGNAGGLNYNPYISGP